MDDTDRLALHGRMESQALLGDTVLVDGESDGWARVVLPAQPSTKDRRGYPGWLPVAQLADWDRPPAPAAMVRVPTTSLFDAPSGRHLISDVSFATVLAVAGPAQDGWLPVHMPGDNAAGAWLPEADVDIASASYPAPKDFLTAARLFIDLPYLWGGTCGLGLDCSGLVYATFRRLGITVPRDAHDQAAAAPTRVAPADIAPGDLMFFASRGKPIHHVGIAVGDGAMLHAPETGRAVTEEPVPPARLEQLVGAGRWL